MDDMTVNGNRSEITISNKDKFLEGNNVLLCFRYHGNNSRTTTILTEDDLDAVIELIIKYKRHKTQLAQKGDIE